MNVMSLDCEFNQPSQKLIQIGAAVFKVSDKTLIDSLIIYVNPEEPLNPDIIALTGITDEEVQKGVTPAEAYELLKEFHKKNRPMMNPIVWGSGVRNDSLVIYQQSGSLEPNFMGFRVIDAKTIYQSQQMVRNKRVKAGLKTACEALGLPFVGRAHQAYDDAYNTFHVWHALAIKLK